MKYFILTLLLIVATDQALSQCFINKGIGGVYDDQANSIAVDNGGDIFITGSFQGTVDFDPGPGVFNLTSLNNSSNQSVKSGFICKFDAIGNFVWAKKTDTWGYVGSSPTINSNSWNFSNGSCEPKRLAIDNLGNLYITGNYTGSVAFNAPQTNSGLVSNGTCFLWKLDNNGNFNWVKSWVATSSNSLTIDVTGNIYVTGCFSGTSNLLPGSTGANTITSAGGKDIFIHKFSNSGNTVWNKNFGGTGDDESKSICIDNNGDIYTTGYFSTTVDFNGIWAGSYNLTSNGWTDIFVQKLNSAGQFISAISIGGPMYDRANGIVCDSIGNAYVTGMFAPGNGVSVPVDFDPGVGVYNLTCVGNSDIFVWKIDGNGNFVWAKKTGGSNLDEAFGIALDSFENVYTTGYYVGISDFDPSANIANLSSTVGSSSYKDIFIWKLTSSGDYVWANSYGGNDEDTGLDIITDDQGNVYSSGLFSNTADFDPGINVSNLTSNGLKDIYFQKIQPDYIPTITASGPISFCPGGSVTLTSSSTTGNTWSTGATTQSISVNSAGTYSVAYSNGTCVTNSAPMNVTLLSAPATPIITANSPTTFCSGGNVTLTSSSASGNTWSNGATTQAITVNSSGNYSVNVTNGTCSTASVPQQINVIQYPIAPTITTSGATSFCPGGSVTLTSNSANGNTWSNGETTQSIIVNTQGSYTVSNANGLCVSNSTPIVTSILPAPVTPIISLSGPTSFCEGDSVILTSNSATNNIWSTGETSQFIVVNTTGDYDVSVSNGTCSTSSNPIQLNVISYPSPPIISANGPTTFCEGDSVILSSNTTIGNLWSNGNTTQSITVFTTDNFSVSVSNGGCVSNSDLLSVITNPSPIINTQPASTQVNIGNQAVFTTSANGGTYQWQENSGSGFQNITNGGQFSGATTNTLTISNTTMTNNSIQYQCVVTSNNCLATSDAATLTVINNAGLGEVNSLNYIEIYPNPTSNFVIVNINDNLVGNGYEIVDNTGRTVVKGVLLNENQLVDLNNLSTGIYSFKVIGELSRTVKLFIN